MWTLLFCQTQEEDSEDINQSLDNDPEQQGMSKDRVEMIKNFFINFTNIDSYTVKKKSIFLYPVFPYTLVRRYGSRHG